MPQGANHGLLRPCGPRNDGVSDGAAKMARAPRFYIMAPYGRPQNSIQASGAVCLRFTQTSACAVESTWSPWRPAGNVVSSARVSASQGAASGRKTKPFSIVAVLSVQPHDPAALRGTARCARASRRDQLLDQLAFPKHCRSLDRQPADRNPPGPLIRLAMRVSPLFDSNAASKPLDRRRPQSTRIAAAGQERKTNR
jgi:hypothetical protein